MNFIVLSNRLLQGTALTDGPLATRRAFNTGYVHSVSKGKVVLECMRNRSHFGPDYQNLGVYEPRLRPR